MYHVIIGAGPAGIVAAEALRKLDSDSQVTVIGDEPEPPYSRMAIPYYLIDQIDERGTYLRKQDGHWEQLGIELMQDRVTTVQANEKRVTLASGAALGYDKLLIATGSQPAMPPIPGVGGSGVHACWTLEDARNIMQRARPGARVVLIGAGFIGCIVLEALAERGTEVTVVEMQERMVPRMLNDVAGNLVKNWCQAKGVTVLTATGVKAIESGAGGASAVILDNGTSIEADLVIVATGVRPNIAFLEGSGVNTEAGILVDHQLQTSSADIFAAGDVAQGLDFATGEYSVHAIQPTAADHGRVAASNMAGRMQAYQGSLGMNVLATMGLISASFGLWQGVDGGDSVEVEDAERYRYLNLQFQDDRLVGASSLGLTEHVGVIRGLIQSRVRLKDWKQKLLQDPTRLMEAYLARTQALGYNAGVL